MEEVKRIKKYNNIYLDFGFESSLRDIAEAVKKGFRVYILDKEKPESVFDVRGFTFPLVIEFLAEIDRNISERKKISSDNSSSSDRYLCYYITEEEAENTQQAEEQEEEA